MLVINRLLSGFSLCVAALQLAGCAIGVTHSLDKVTPSIAATSGPTIVLAVQDKRSFVVNGDKSPSFVGLSRGSFGNPFDVNTKSGKSLASDISTLIRDALNKKGVKVINVEIAPNVQENKVIQLLTSKGDKSIFLKIISWKTDTYNETSLSYNLELMILDKSGQILGSSSLSGSESISSPSWTVPAKVPMLLTNKIETLFADPKISSQL